MQSITFCPLAVMDSDVFCRCSHAQMGGSHLLEVKTVELFLRIYFLFVLSLQSVLLPLSTLHFPAAWWHSQDVNSRTGLLLFGVSFNPPTGSCRFFRTSTFLTGKLWGGEMGEGKHYISSPTHL